MLLSILKSLRVARGNPAVADGPAELLATAEATFAEAAQVDSPFRRDALHDQVTTLMARALGPTLWRYCAAQPGTDAAAAEDLAQQAFVVFRASLPTFERRSSLKTFLYGIATNLARAAYAKATRQERILAAHGDDVACTLHGAGVGPANADEDLRRREALERALDQLPPREAYLVRARLADQLDYEHILPRFQARFGDSIQTPEGLRTLFFHVRKRLVALLREAP